MDDTRAWVDRDWTVGVVARGRRVLSVVKCAVDGGRHWRHRVVDCTPGRTPVVLTDEALDCQDPVLLSDGCLLVRTDCGERGGPMQVAERDPNGEWRVWTDSADGVTSFAAAESSIVVLERVDGAASPWGAEVAVCEAGPVRFWNAWHTEVVHRLVLHDRRSGTRRPLGISGGRELSRCDLALSPDGRWLAYTPQRVAEDGILQKGLVVRRLPQGPGTRFVWGPPSSDHSAPVFSPDGTRLAFLRHTRPRGAHGRRQLMVLDLETGEETAVAPDWPGWLEPKAWSEADGIVCLATTEEQVGAFSVRPGDDAPVRLDTKTWSWDDIAVGERIWGLGSRLDTRPVVRPIDETGPPSVLGEWSDALPCPTMFWPAAAKGPRPLVLMVHGGPVYAWSNAWHPRQAAAFFHDRGFHVLLPNPVGSTGHGDAHVDAIWHDWDRCTDQLIALLHQAAARDDVSGLVLFGGSFGGWAVNRLATRTDLPPVRGIITHAGIYDHHTMVGACDEPDLFGWHLGAGSEALHRADPARSVENWTAPTLILHGAKDFCVPVDQAIALHHALEERGVEHRLVVFPDEGHHVLAPRHKARWWEAVGRFVREVCGPSVSALPQ